MDTSRMNEGGLTMRNQRAIGFLIAIVLLAGTVQAQHMDLSAEPEEVPASQQERAYTSAIWYTT